MSKKNIERKYERLAKLLKRSRVLLEQEEERVKETPPEDKAIEDPKQQLEKRRSAVANFTKVTKATSRSSNVIVNSHMQVINEVEEGKKDSEFALKNIVVDITKLKNELEKYKNLDPEKKKQVEEIQKTARYFTTTHNQLRKSLDELQDKKRKFNERMEEIEREKEEKEEQLRRDLGIEEVEKVENSMKEIEKNTGDQIKQVRELCKDLYDAPIEMIESAKIYITALGATGVLSPKSDRYNMSKEGIKKVLDDPELFEKLGEFISITKQADKYQVVNVEIPKMQKYFAELEIKAKDFQDDADASSEQMGESIIKSISDDVKEKLKVGAKASFNFFIEVGKSVIKGWNEFSNGFSKAVESDRQGLEQFRKDGKRFVLKIQKLINEDKAEQIKKAEQKL